MVRTGVKTLEYCSFFHSLICHQLASHVHWMPTFVKIFSHGWSLGPENRHADAENLIATYAIHCKV